MHQSKQIMQEELKNILQKKSSFILIAYMFGSRSLGTSKSSSDLDIALYLDQFCTAHFFDIKIDLYVEINKTLKINDIDIVIMNQCSNVILLNEIVSKGTVLFEKDTAFRIDYEQKILHNAIDFTTQRKMAMGDLWKE